MSWVAVGVGAVSFAGSMMGAADEQDQMVQSAKSYGIKTAGISFGANRRQGVLVSQASAIVEGSRMLEMSVDKAQAHKEAMIRVQAAVTGVGGDNVDDTISQTEIDAMDAKYKVDQQRVGALNQKAIDFIDVAINADISKGFQDTSTKSGETAVLKGGLSFMQGFFSAGGSIGGGGAGGTAGDDWSVYGGGEEWNF